MNLPQKNRVLLFLVLLIPSVISLGLYLENRNSTDFEINVLEMENYPVLLQTYREPSLINRNTPFGSPLGGKGLENTTITAYYLASDYKQNFGADHWGVDLIPSDNYYKNSWVYLNIDKMVFFATHSGRAEYFVDQFGGNYLQITNAADTIRTHYVHMQASYIRTGQNIEVGQPIGLIGHTGNATGNHLHYAIQIKDKNGKWVYNNPLPYIGK
ncbi:M23 family metallopeptidase [bacterium]|nr:M23 family metallopeptidase [bacterium]